MGLEASQRYAHTLLSQAEKALRDSGLRETHALQALARMVVERAH
jgi:farnesyl diphosphate synthase